MQSHPHVRLRKEAFLTYAASRGYTTNLACALACGIDPAQYSRMIRDMSLPGERFIAGALLHFPECRFDDLFEVVPGDGAQRSAA